MPDTTPHKPDDKIRKKVESYAAVGIPHEDIAKVIGIDKKTLYKYYRPELDTAATKADAAVGGALYSKAIAGDTTAMIWWSKARMRWKETKTQENQDLDKDGNPIDPKKIEVVIVEPKDTDT